ncbi:hypothetical protein, partial [Cronobacter sakazakii]|uniref:hypothetical protein n=1 Tax=Cronobacter sakazakii TaxID=28141 RepID=UPI00195AF59F
TLALRRVRFAYPPYKTATPVLRRVRFAYPPYKTVTPVLRRVRFAYPPYSKGMLFAFVGWVSEAHPTFQY